MKARILGLVTLFVLSASFQVHADDAAIAKQLSKQLQQAKQQGDLQHFRINVKVEEGTVWMKGRVASQDHLNIALNKAQRVPGVKLVVNDIEVSPVAQASAVQPATQPATQAPARVANVRGNRQADFSTVVSDGLGEYNHQVISGGGVSGAGFGNPVPVSGSSYGGGGGGGAVYESAQLPNYAWPAYAPHPNYASVQYPKQYSPTAWPYIGPFYPYPQVPLGWRKVSLEWDDGWWQLDFTHK